MLQIADSSILLQIDIGVVNLYFKGTARSFQKNWWHFKREWITKICYDVFISNQIFTMFRVTTGCPTKSYSSRHPSQPDLDEPVSGNYFFGRFLLRLSRIKRFQVMPRGKFGSAGCSTQFRLGFLGFSSILKVTFLDTQYKHHWNLEFRIWTQERHSHERKFAAEPGQHVHQ